MKEGKTEVAGAPHNRREGGGKKNLLEKVTCKSGGEETKHSLKKWGKRTVALSCIAADLPI